MSGAGGAAFRPVFTREEAVAAVTKLRALVDRSDKGDIQIEHSMLAVTQIANNTVLDGSITSEVSLRFPSLIGSTVTMRVGTNQIDDSTLQAVAHHLKALRAPPSPDPVPPDDPDSPVYNIYAPRPAMPASLWHDNTVEALRQVPKGMMDQTITRMQQAQLIGAATMAISARATYYSYQLGLEAWAEETDAEVTVTARRPDGTVSGWGGQANRDWSALAFDERVLSPAIALAQLGGPAVAVEPGRRTVILGPAAVGQLVAKMAECFRYTSATGGASPFADAVAPSRTKLGAQVFDARLRLVSDPADVGGGFLPFYENDGNGIPGLPIPKMVWIEGGVLQNLCYSIDDAMDHRKPWSELPYSVRLEAMPGTPTATVAEMIAHCEQGLYINRLSGVDIVDPISGTMSGTTRDGCFFVEHGKITKAVKNFRFLDSPFVLFNNVLLVGQAERMAFGYTSMSLGERFSAAAWPPIGRLTRWPRTPVIVPPLMIRDFNLTSLTEAV